MSQRRLRLRLGVCGMLAAALAAAVPARAIDLGALGGAADTVQRASGAATAGQQVLGTGEQALSTGQRALDAGRTGAEEARNLWQRSQQTSPGAVPVLQAPAGAAQASDEQGGPRRLLAVLGDVWAGSARRGQAVVALTDQGPYFVQRQAAHIAAPSAQWLATPRGDSTGVAIDLPAEPEGTTYDLATGRVRPGGRGVRIYALTVHADVPGRAHRRALDAIEQHAMLRASSVRTEWPHQPGDILEATGGKLLVWSSDAAQRFPAGFGADGRLFTPDDPMVTLPRGYTVVTLDAQGFRFDRGREIALAFHPVQPAADIDLSRLATGDAVAALIGLIAERHPQAAAAGFDAAALRAEYGPRAQTAADRRDSAAQAQVLADIGLRVRDGLYRVQLPGGLYWPARTDRGLSAQAVARGPVPLPMPRLWLRDDGRLFAASVAPGSPAAQAGLQPGAEIRSIDGDSPARYLEKIAAASARATAEGRRQDVLPLDLATPATLALRVQQQPGGQEQDLRVGALPATAPTTAAATAEPALAAFQLRSVQGRNVAYIARDSFADGSTGQLERWERSLAAAAQNRVAGLVIDLRAHSGDSHQLLPHMLASLYPRERPLRLQDAAQRSFDPATRVWRSRGALGLPPQFALAAAGTATSFTAPIAVITGPDCAGPCELFAAWLQHSQRADIVATGPTAGALGHTVRVHLPGGFVVQVPLLAETGPGARDAATTLQGRGIAPRQKVPVDAAFVAAVQAGGDPLLDAAVRRLEQSTAPAPAVRR